MIKLKLIYEQLLKEVGEIENITPYDYSQRHNVFQFSTDDGKNVEVEFHKYDEDDVKQLNLEGNIYNLAFRVDGDETQKFKSNYSYLIKIIATVFEISKNFINSHPEVNNITLFAANKNKDKHLSTTDKQKSNLYLVVFLKNRNKLNGNWWYKNIKLYDNFEGILLYKE